VFNRRVEQASAIHAVLQRIERSASDTDRVRLIVSAWRIGASADEIAEAATMTRDELRGLLDSEGALDKKRFRGWR